jgi:hypothetical protein
MRKGEEEGGRGNYLWRRRKESAVLTEGDHEVTGGGSGAPGKPTARESCSLSLTAAQEREEEVAGMGQLAVRSQSKLDSTASSSRRRCSLSRCCS